MAVKSLKFFSCVVLLFVALSVLSHARPEKQKGEEKSPFEFLKRLQGCHKGEKVQGLDKLKRYLEHFGYLDYHRNKNQTHADDDDDFDDFLEIALRTYQLNYHLNATRTLDAQTVSMMLRPRCGMPDILNGTNWMKRRHHNNGGSHSFHTVSHYSFFPSSPRWPASQTHLTYAFAPNTPREAIGPVARAFDKWASATFFSFSHAGSYESANLKIGFYRRHHGDRNPFDGPGGTIAHAAAPTGGRFHYDADESWSIGPVTGAFDLETVALHEIGHLLGLGHSEVEDAIMWPTISKGTVKGLHADDIQGIKALYNV